VYEKKSLCGGKHYANISVYLPEGRWNKCRFIPIPRSRHSAIIYSTWYKPVVYTSRTHFGNRGNADVRVERRLAPSGGDDISLCGWHGSGSGSFYGSPERTEENGLWRWRLGGVQPMEIRFYRVNYGGEVLHNNMSRTLHPTYYTRTHLIINGHHLASLLIHRPRV